MDLLKTHYIGALLLLFMAAIGCGGVYMYVYKTTPSFGAVPPSLATQGGTGWTNWTNGAIPIGVRGGLRFATSSGFNFATTSGTLTVNNLTVNGTCTGCVGGRYLTLGVATTTTWTATTSGPYIPFANSPIAGTLTSALCKTDTSFLGVAIQINGTPVTPSYFLASSTSSSRAITAANTVSVGSTISALFGTTTTSGTTSVSCTITVV